MKKLSYLLLPMMLLLLSSCAGTTNVTTIDQTGRQVPMPHYVLKSMDDNFQVLYYWSKHSGYRDLDGTPLTYPTYFDFTKKNQKINTKEVTKIVLTIEVLNANLRPYELWERSTMHDRNRMTISRGGRLAHSNQRMRVYEFELPLHQEYEFVDYSIDLVDESGMPIMHFGSYEYEILKAKKKGGDSISHFSKN